MAHIAFKARYRDRALFKSVVRRPAFGNIAKMSRRPVTVHIANRIRRNIGIAESLFKRHLHGILVGLRDVFAIRIVPEADKFRVNVGSASLGMFIFFEHERPSTFANDQAIAIAVIGSRRQFRGIVLYACRKQRIEYGRFGCRQFFGSTCNHHVLHAIFDGLVSITDRKATARARRIRRDDSPSQSKEKAHVYRTSLRHRLDIRRQRDLRTVVRRILHGNKIEKRAYAPHGRTESDSHASRLEEFIIIHKSSHLHGLIGRRYGQQACTPRTANLFTRIFRQVVENRARQARIHLRILVPIVHTDNMIFQSLEFRKNIVQFHPQGCNATAPGNDYATTHANPPLTEMT